MKLDGGQQRRLEISWDAQLDAEELLQTYMQKHVYMHLREKLTHAFALFASPGCILELSG